MVKEWSVHVAFDATPDDVANFEPIADDALDALLADPITLGPVIAADRAAGWLAARVSLVADDEPDAVARAIAAIGRAFRAAGANLGAVREVDLIRQDVLSAQVGVPPSLDDEDDDGEDDDAWEDEDCEAE